MPTIRAYLDGQPPESAVEVTGKSAMGATLRAARKLGYRGKALWNDERLSARHLLVTLDDGTKMHVLEESRSGSSGAPKRGRAVTSGGLRIDLVLDATEARCLEALMQPGETRTRRIAQLIVDAYEEQSL